MNILVCVKRVPDTGARIEIEEEGPGIKKETVPWVLNPYDEFAVEEAIRVKERFGANVTLITAGAEGGEEILKKGVAMGADDAVYIKDPSLEGMDGVEAAKVISLAIKDLPFDIIFCGKQAADGDGGVTGGALAVLLCIPLVSSVKRLEIFPEENRAEALREIEGGMEALECRLPALFTAQKGLNEPRYPTLQGIMRAKRCQVRYIDLCSLGIKGSAAGKGLKRERLFYPPLERKGIVLKGDIFQAARDTVKFLKEEVKVL